MERLLAGSIAALILPIAAQAVEIADGHEAVIGIEAAYVDMSGNVHVVLEAYDDNVGLAID